ncbi:MAG: DegT/DnrJ/EryC1/StrS family aminotransferase [Actinobacteria bacterium]|nr:DegT/DnrJ/EryC1/StrS family aminotransferase [Actinomycetota bacterium]
MKINFIDLKQQYFEYKSEIDEAIRNIIEQTAFIQGKEVANLEKNLARYTGSQYCISCGSGTDALLLSLMGIGIKPGDEIITVPFTFFATAEVIAFLGAKPIFVDIEEKTYNIDVNLIEKKITSKTKAIIPVSLYGQPADMDEIVSLGKKNNLIIIEDAAQSFGAKYKNKKSCNLSQIGCTSFYPAKPLGCYGDGGAIFTNDEDLSTKMRCMMNHGQTETYSHKYIGINGRLDAIQAAVLNIKLRHFEEEIAARKKVAEYYSANIKTITDLIPPYIKNDRTSVYAQYSIRVKEREDLIAFLKARDIPTAIHYKLPLYAQEVFAYLNLKPSDFPVTEEVCKEIVSLPMSPFLTMEHQDVIISGLKEFYEGSK